jgi:hypothetical protein
VGIGGEQGPRGHASEIMFQSEHIDDLALPHCKHLQLENGDKRADEAKSSAERISL